MILEKFVSFVYHGVESDESIDLLRLRDFEYSTHNNSRLIPPSRSGLLQHFKRAAYASGWVAFQCAENVVLPSALEYGYKTLTNGQLVTNWCNDECDPLHLTSTCSCTKAKCTSCNCSRKSPPLSCLPFCGCRGTCQFKPI